MRSLARNDNRRRFSVDQVLAGIEYFLSDHCGESVVLDPEKSVLAYEEEARAYVDFCPLEFLCGLAEYFQLDWRSRRWIVWLGLSEASKTRGNKAKAEAYERWEKEIAPGRKVRDLAQLIANRAPCISFEPVTIFGNNCGPAGAFYGLCQLPEVQEGCHGPSTPLRSVLGAWSCSEFWNRVEWISGKRLPKLSDMQWHERPLRTQVSGMMIHGSSLLAATIAATFLAIHGWIFFAGLAAFLLVMAGKYFDHAVQYRLDDPFPEDVKTLGDLARLICAQAQVQGR